jgi:DNA-binding NarL/FixJ family response regulator
MTTTLPEPILNSLTSAERLVAVHVAQGMSNKEIAALLGKAEPTVKHQVSSILRSANVQSRCQFIALYYQQFFCPLPFPGSFAAGLSTDLIFAASVHGAKCS